MNTRILVNSMFSTAFTAYRPRENKRMWRHKTFWRDVAYILTSVNLRMRQFWCRLTVAVAQSNCCPTPLRPLDGVKQDKHDKISPRVYTSKPRLRLHYSVSHNSCSITIRRSAVYQIISRHRKCQGKADSGKTGDEWRYIIRIMLRRVARLAVKERSQVK